MSLGSPLRKSTFSGEKESEREAMLLKSMSLHRKALGLDNAMLQDSGSGEINLEHKFKEQEKKLEQSAKQLKEEINKSKEPQDYEIILEDKEK